MGPAGWFAGRVSTSTVAGLLGVSSGKRLADKLPATTLIRWFVLLLALIAAYVATQATLGLLHR